MISLNWQYGLCIQCDSTLKPSGSEKILVEDILTQVGDTPEAPLVSFFASQSFTIGA